MKSAQEAPAFLLLVRCWTQFASALRRIIARAVDLPLF